MPLSKFDFSNECFLYFIDCLFATLHLTYSENLSEFKLESTEWEKVIIDYFILNNKDPKVAEPIRNLDLENLSKYLPLIKNTKIKN